MIVAIIFSALTFCAVVAVCYVVYFLWQKEANREYQNQRVEQVVNIKSSGYSETSFETQGKKEEENPEQKTLRRDTRTSTIPILDIILSKFFRSASQKLMIFIEQSGLKIKVGEFILLSFCLSIIGALVVNTFAHIPYVGIAVGAIPLILLNSMREKRLQSFLVQLPQALDMLSNDVKAGLDVQSGLKHLSEEFKPPLGEEFAKIVVEINLGLALSQALNNLCNRINIIDVQILCTGIIINREMGGNLSELIGNISNTVRERFKLKGMIKALTAENQITSLLLILLPVALYILLTFMAPDTYGVFTSDPLGQKIIIGCIISMTIGYTIIRKVTKVEV